MVNVFQALNGAAVTPSDSDLLPFDGINANNVASLRNGAALYIGSAGDVTVKMLGGQTVTFTAVPAGTFMPIQCIQVFQSGTSAGSITAIW